MKSSDWNTLLYGETAEPDAKKVRRIVAREAARHLSTLAPGITITTNQLLDALYPRAVAEASLAGDTVRGTLAVILQKLALTDLQDCCEKGEVQGKYFGHDRRPWLWFAPERGLCPHCGQVMPESGELLKDLT